MRGVVLALGAALAMTLPGRAEDNRPARDQGAPETGLPGEAPIRVTINPEGRVSVALGGALPAPAPCGKPVVFGIEVVNQGYATARLEAQLVGNPPAGATLDFRPEPLKGVPLETRTLRVTLSSSAPTDLTIAFRLHGEVPDLGGRDRIHLLLRSATAARSGP
jgi:hypothetical protein